MNSQNSCTIHPPNRRSGGRLRGVLVALSVGCLVTLPCRTRAEPPSTSDEFHPSAELDLAALSRAVRDHSPALQQDHLAVDLSQSDARQSRLIDNPVLDAAVGTIPLGTANPSDLPNPLQNIPNYGVGLSIHPDLARRGARIERASHLVEAADAQRRASVRAQALSLLRSLGDLAIASLRQSADVRLVTQSRSALALARDRVRTGFGPPLDADRAEIELLRLEQQVAADQGDILAAQAMCGQFVGSRCATFPDEAEARRFLARWFSRAETMPPRIETRPDLLALTALQAAACAEERQAYSQRIPDPTIRVGYLYDRFVASGNQQHSMSVSLSTPLALIDHGQSGIQAAQSRARRFAEQKRLTIRSSEVRIDSLKRALMTQRQRLGTLQEQVLPRGQAILRDVRRAFEARAVPLTDLNQAQRALDELLLQEATTLGDLFRLSVDLVQEGVSDE